MNYPNPIDRLNNKTGGGIWLHSTNNETRIEKGLDSRGCIVATNKELIEISTNIELHRTPIVVVENLNFSSKENWGKQKSDLESFVASWRKAWQSENLKNYLDSYHPELFRDPIRGKFKSFSKYKTAVFSRAGKPEVNLSNMSIIKTTDYAVISFVQHYKSNSINDTGRKTLYLKQDEFYRWRIVGEYWTKVASEQNSIAFRPSNRFFETTNPGQIMEFKSLRTGNESAPITSKQ
jgi:murein L,D-transpeptidase YafK